jgi:two-component system response regulator MprA
MAATPMASVGICEDDDEVRGVVRTALERDGLRVRPTASGSEAVRSFGDEPPDLLVFDVGLPDAAGRDVCQALRARGVRGAGPLPHGSRRAARCRQRLPGRRRRLPHQALRGRRASCAGAALLRRPDGAPRAASGAPTLRLDPAAHALVRGDVHVRLTPTEFRLLGALAASPGDVVRRRALVAAGWPDGAIVHDKTLDAYVARLRRKLTDAGTERRIETVRRVGYVLR